MNLDKAFDKALALDGSGDEITLVHDGIQYVGGKFSVGEGSFLGNVERINRADDFRPDVIAGIVRSDHMRRDTRTG